MKKYITVVAILVLAAFTLNMELYASAAEVKSGNFTDIKNHWAKDTIIKFTERGFVKGIGNNMFAPDNKIKRVEFVALIHRILDIKIYYFRKPNIAEVYSDCKENSWYEYELYDLYSTGIVDDKGSFRPDEYITREEMMHYMVNAYCYQFKVDKSSIDINNVTVYDSGLASKKYAIDVLISFLLGLVKGRVLGYAEPKEFSTRAEAVTILDRFLSKIENGNNPVPTQPVISNPPVPTQIPNPGISSDSVVTASNASGFEAFKKINSNEFKGKNFMISPASIYTCLGMLLNGADGKTLEEMKNTLKVSSMDITKFNEQMNVLLTALNRNTGGIELHTANSIWIRKSLEGLIIPSFKEICTNFFKAEPGYFEKPQDNEIINKWCSEKTNGKIPEVLGPIDDPNQLMFLINAIYFNATWQHEFEAKEGKMKFNTPSGVKDVSYMSNTANYDYMETSDLKGIRFKYGKPGAKDSECKASMYLLVPQGKLNIEEFIANMNDKDWDKCMQSFKSERLEVNVPKWEYRTDVNSMVETYKALGMDSAFSPAEANFAKLAKQPAYVNKFIHKSFIKVHEKGTEAAAVTAIGIGVTSVQIPPKTFVVDRPFVYAIVDDETKTIMFLGKVTDPSIN